MADIDSSVRHRFRFSLRRAFAVLVLVALARPATAQPLVPPRPDGAEFMSRYDFHLSAAALAHEDQRFSWDTHWGGDLDLVDYVKGRLTFLADYQAVLGDEFQPFDPNQGNYTLAVSGSVRPADATEVVFVFNHVSRHLGDRPKRFGIAWNVLGTRLLRDVRVGGTTFGVQAEAGYVTQRAHVDYRWTAGLDLRVFRQTSPRVAWFGRLHGEWVGVSEDRVGRKGQQGGNGEAGVRVGGPGGVIELFVGYAKVIDADPLDRQPAQWAFAGFRVLDD
jgi:hypothetical protein